MSSKSMQENAEEGVKMSKCTECKYEHDSAIDEPCVSCSKSTNHFEPKKHSSNCTISVKECNKAFKNEDYGYEEILNDEIDMANHPPQYQYGIEPIEFIESHNLNFNLGSAVKYITRAHYKGKELEDLKKAKWFIEREIKRHDN